RQAESHRALLRQLPYGISETVDKCRHGNAGGADRQKTVDACDAQHDVASDVEKRGENPVQQAITSVSDWDDVEEGVEQIDRPDAVLRYGHVYEKRPSPPQELVRRTEEKV